MKRDLVNEKQVFGKVIETPMMPSTLATPKPYDNRVRGDETVNGNNGVTVVESFAHKNPGAFEQASRGRANPYMYVGEDFGPGHVHMTERQTNAL